MDCLWCWRQFWMEQLPWSWHSERDTFHLWNVKYELNRANVMRVCIAYMGFRGEGCLQQAYLPVPRDPKLQVSLQEQLWNLYPDVVYSSTSWRPPSVRCYNWGDILFWFSAMFHILHRVQSQGLGMPLCQSTLKVEHTPAHSRSCIKEQLILGFNNIIKNNLHSLNIQTSQNWKTELQVY